MKVNQHFISVTFRILFCLLLLLMAFCCGYAQCNTGVNVALNKTVTASSLENASYPASNAVDGNGGTRWSSAYNDNEYIYVDLGSSYPLCQVVLSWEVALGRNFTIDISPNASTWTTAATVTGNTSFTNTISITGSGRYVRMKGTLRGTGYGYSLYEFQVFSTNASPVCPTTNIALNKTGIVSSLENAVYGVANAFDGNPATRWSSAFSDPQSIYVDLGAQYALCSVDLSWETAYATSFEIDGSNNAIAWTTLSNVTGNTSLTNTIPVAGAYRYVRMYGTTRATGYGYSLYEFAVHGSTVLPISLGSFSADEKDDGHVNLTWTDGDANNELGFLVERSGDAKIFDSVGYVKNNRGQSAEGTYQFSDILPGNGIYYYRLRQNGIDGKTDFSKILEVKWGNRQATPLALVPNPVAGSFILSGQELVAGADISISDLSGHLLRRLSQVHDGTPVNVSDLAPGLYLVSVNTRTGFQTLRLLKK